MKRMLLASVLTTLIIPANLLLSSASGKIIYGDDNRIDYHKMSPAMKNLSDSVVSLWESRNVSFKPETDSYRLYTKNFGRTLNLCIEEKFREQPMGAFCSGSLVGDDMIMTAGHCITDEYKCKSTKFVFGYSMKNDKEAETLIGKSDVYSCQKIVARFLGNEPSNDPNADLGADYALVKLDRPVTGRKPLQINRKKNIKKGTELFVIGHPVGLPVKVANDSSVRNADSKGFFVANLDTYGGNSGSPVFDKKTKLIEGILVRGDRDFITTPEGCKVSNTVPQAGGRGEDVTKIEKLASFIPQTEGEKTVSRLVKNNTIKTVDIESMSILRFETKDNFNIPIPSFKSAPIN